MAGFPFLWLKRFWSQIRWQLAACYLLIGGVSVILVAAFGLAAMNMLILRSSTVAVERQLDLFVQTTAGRTEAIAARVEAQAEAALNGGRPGQPLFSAPRLPGTAIAAECRSAQRHLSFLHPPESVIELPGWLQEDSFQGLVSEGRRIDIRAFARRRGSNCVVEVVSRMPLDAQLAEMISRASELEVSLPGPPPGRPPGRRNRPSESRLVWRQIADFLQMRFGGYQPVAVITRDWRTGAFADRIAFRVLPNYERTMRQLRRFGQRQAIWVRVLWVLGIAFLVVEAGALLLAYRVSRRIVSAIDNLSRAATEIGAGNLSHRLPVRSDDQLGRLGQSFNKMAGSLELLVRETKDRERLQQELRIARQVQESLYPRTLPSVPGVELAAACVPARNVSGDLYDVIEMSSSRLGLLCADVSGKGIPAALLSASLQAVVRSAAQNGSRDAPAPAVLLEGLNDQLCRRIPDNRFITLFWADYDADTRRLRAANAGHCPPVLCLAGDGRVLRLEAGGPPVGVLPSVRYEEQQLILPADSLLLVHTDGVSETENSEGEEFGDERLIDICRRGARRTPSQLIQDVLAARQQWSGAAEQTDDVTLLVMRAR